jgi:hypothetical protein
MHKKVAHPYEIQNTKVIITLAFVVRCAIISETLTNETRTLKSSI